MRLLFFGFLFLITNFLIAQNEDYFPPVGSDDWETTSWTAAGFRPEVETELDSFLAGRDSYACLILKRGRIVYEDYFNGFRQDSFYFWNSAGKSLMATLFGMAVGENLLAPDDRATDYLGRGWTSATPEQEDSIRLINLLRMDSGLDETPDPNCTNPECLAYRAPVGTRWAYHTGAYIQLASAIEAASGQTINQFIRQRLHNKIGTTGLYFQFASNRVYLSSPRSMARFGLLALNEGKWAGEDLIGVPDYWRTATTTSQPLNESYGYLWWLNGSESFLLPQLQIPFPGSVLPAAPADAYAAIGKNGQFVIVVPSEELVIVRMGPSVGEDDPVPILFARQLFELLNRYRETTSVDDRQTNFSVTVSPNPLNDFALVRTEKRVRGYQLFNAAGQLTLARDFDLQRGNFTLDTRNLPAGGYLLRLVAEDGSSAVRKLIKTP